MSNRSQNNLRRGDVVSTQDNGHSQSSGQFPEGHKRQRRAPNELVWTQPRTIPANLHKNVRRVSTPPAAEIPPSKNIVSRPHSRQQKQQQTNSSGLLSPFNQSRDLARDVSTWKMDTDFLDFGGAGDVTDEVVQNLLHNRSTSLPGTNSLPTPQSLDRLLHVDTSYMDAHMSALVDDCLEENDIPPPPPPGSRLNLSSLNGFSAIHLAAYFGKSAVIRLLLSACAEDVDLLNQDGQTPLHIAAAEGHAEVIPELLRSGANALLQDVDGRTALHLAVSKGHLDVVRLLLDDTHGQAMIRVADGAGKTSLHQAVLQECSDIVRLLLERGADPRTPIG